MLANQKTLQRRKLFSFNHPTWKRSVCDHWLRSDSRPSRYSYKNYGELVAVCDLQEEKALAFANQFRVPYYLTMEELISSERTVDVMVICTPNGLHAAQSVQALRQGYHVLVENRWH